MSCARLGKEESSQLWDWLVAQHGLSEATKHATVLEAADSGLGLHAARLPSPYVTATTRTVESADLACLLGAAGDPQLITVRCMRSTLHTLPVGLAEVAHAATRHYRLRAVQNSVRQAGISPGRLSVTKTAIIGELGGGASGHRELERRLARSGHTPLEVRIALKWLWEDGEVTYRNGASSWHRDKRTFALREHTHPSFRRDLDVSSAQRALISAYFERFGPATVKDASWWSGLSQKVVHESLAALDIIRLQLPWAASPFHMLRDKFDKASLAATARGATGVNFLAHEDVLLKGYFESRGRYMGDIPVRAVFNSIGEVLPVILLDGQVIGRWRWDASARAVRYRHFPEAAAPASARRSSRTAARRMQSRLRLGHSVEKRTHRT